MPRRLERFGPYNETSTAIIDLGDVPAGEKWELLALMATDDGSNTLIVAVVAAGAILSYHQFAAAEQWYNEDLHGVPFFAGENVQVWVINPPASGCTVIVPYVRVTFTDDD